MESHMEFFVGQYLLANGFEHRRAASFVNEAVIFQGDDFRHQKNRNLFIEAQQMTAPTEERVRPMVMKQWRV